MLQRSNFCTEYLNERFKDTVNDAASMNVSILGKVELDELPKATGVIVVDSLSVSKSFHDGAEERGRDNKENNIMLPLPKTFWIQMLI